MKRFFSRFVWLFEFIAVALVVTFAIILVTVLKDNETIAYVPFGIAFAVLGIARFVPLIKTTSDKAMKWMNGIELIIDVIAGAILIVLGLASKKDVLGNAFGYIVCAVLYLRAFIYFFSTTIRKENTNIAIFIIHVALMTISCLLIGFGSFKSSYVIWLVFGICVLCSIILLIDGIKKYSGFRNEEYAKKLSKEIKEEESEILIETPSAEQIIEQGEIIEGENPENGLNA